MDKQTLSTERQVRKRIAACARALCRLFLPESNNWTFNDFNEISAEKMATLEGWGFTRDEVILVLELLRIENADTGEPLGIVGELVGDDLCGRGPDGPACPLSETFGGWDDDCGMIPPGPIFEIYWTDSLKTAIEWLTTGEPYYDESGVRRVIPPEQVIPFPPYFRDHLHKFALGKFDFSHTGFMPGGLS